MLSCSKSEETKDELPSPSFYYWFFTSMTSSMRAHSHPVQENIFFGIPIHILISHALYGWYNNNNNNTFKRDATDRFWLKPDDDVAHAPGLYYSYSVGVGDYGECCRSCGPRAQQQVFRDGAFGHRFLHVFSSWHGRSTTRRYNLY